MRKQWFVVPTHKEGIFYPAERDSTKGYFAFPVHARQYKRVAAALVKIHGSQRCVSDEFHNWSLFSGAGVHEPQHLLYRCRNIMSSSIRFL